MLLELHYLASVPDHTIDMPRPNLESTAVPALTPVYIQSSSYL